jgi:hypothetical protein
MACFADEIVLPSMRSWKGRRIVSRKGHLIASKIKPDLYAIYQNTGAQLHGQIAVPNGNCWLPHGHLRPDFAQGGHNGDPAERGEAGGSSRGAVV